MTTDAGARRDRPGGRRRASWTPWSRRWQPARCAGLRHAAATRDRRRSTSSSPRCTAPDEVAFAVELFGRVEAMPRPAPAHHQGRHHGRGAPHLAQPQGLHRAAAGADRLHQHRIPRPHRRRDPHLDAGRARGRARTHAERALDLGVRGPATSTSGSRAACSAAPRSARGCGPRPTAWPRCWRPRSASRRRAPAAPGCPRRTAATLHALHYHQVDVARGRRELAAGGRRGRARSCWRAAGRPVAWSDEERQEEIDNNCQCLLGYVVRWVDPASAAPRSPTSPARR